MPEFLIADWLRYKESFMAIYFNCVHCGKALFSQDQYAAREVICPGCQTRNTIPSSATAPSQDTAQLLDMESPQAGVLDCATALRPPEAPSNRQECLPHSVALGTEATKICPLCAEIIKAAARKCRFCGAILDEKLKEDENDHRREQAMLAVVTIAERSTNVWRSVAIASGICTVAWLSYLTLNLLLTQEPPYLLIGFNVLLIFGLFRSVRQMRTGAYTVFLAAAMAVLLCMPLNLQLGLVMVDDAMLEQMRKNMPPNQPQPTAAQLQALLLLIFSGIGFVFSIPIWLAALKVAAFQRLKNTFGGK
ncbi:MAG: hypothetical protein V1899_07695 [Planctomycetota bacterium]